MHSVSSSDNPPPACRRLITIAARDPRRAVLIARHAMAQIPPDAHMRQAWACYTLGWTLVQWERLAEATMVLHQAHQLFSQLHQTLPLLHCQRAILQVSLLDGTESAQQTDWEALATAYTTAGALLEAARTRISQIWHLNLLGRPQEAGMLAEQIAPAIRAGTYDDQGRLHRVQAVAYGNMGMLNQAQEHIAAAIGCFTQIHARIEIAKCRGERAWIFQRSEHFSAALQDLEQARAVFQHCAMPLRVTICERDRGLVLSRLGQYDQALTTTLHARSQLIALEQHAAAATCDINLGIIAYYSGLFDLARAAYQRALAVYTERGIQRLQAVCQRNQALALLGQNQSAAALEIAARTEKFLQMLGEQMEEAEVILVRAMALRSLHRSAEAAVAFQYAYHIFTTLGISPGAAKCQLEQGWLYLEQADPDAAQRCLSAAQEILAERPMHTWRIAYGLARCAEMQGYPDLALAHYQAACTLVARLRRRLASEHASSGQFVQAESLFSDALRLAANQHNPELVLLIAEQQRALALQRQVEGGPFHIPADLQDQYETVRANVRVLLEQITTDRTLVSDELLTTTVATYTDLLLQARHITPLPDPIPDMTLDLDDLRQQFTHAFPDGWMALIYVWCRDELLIIMLTMQDLTLTRKTVDPTLQRLLEQACLPRYRLFTYLDLPSWQDQTNSPWTRLHVLGDLLIPPDIRANLHPDLRLLIVPGGVLHALPWAALRIDGDWLCTRGIIQMLPGITSWLTLARRTPSGDAALLVGCSQFAERAPDLPHVPASLDLVEATWTGQVTRLEQAAVSRETLQTLVAADAPCQYAMLYIATHAQLVARHGVLAHLKLHNDDLFLDEVLRLHLYGTLVVLATCDGAVSEVLPGEEVMSLSRAFLIAGARDVIASLWQIYDRAVEGILTPLYAALAQGEDAPTALTRAQRTLIERAIHAEPDDIATSPLIWASLTVIGAGTPWQSAGGTKPTACHPIPG